MKTVLKGLTNAALLAAVLAAPAAAQQKSWGLGVHGAYFKSGTLAQGGNTQLQMDNDRAIGGHLEKWFGSGRMGLRLDASYTTTPWILDFDEDANGTPSASAQSILSSYGDVGIWLADADLMLRILSPKIDRRFAPFLSLGGGFVRWDNNQSDTQGEFDLRVPEADVQIYGYAQSEPAITGSIGTDFFLSRSVALRLEAKDYYNPNSPYIVLSNIGDSKSAGGSRHHDATNQMVYTAGLAFLFGGRREEPGFIAVAPAPAPAPAPARVVQAPAPPPAPTTEQVNMCVVDQNGRLQIVNATRNLQTRNVYVTRNGQDVLFSTAYPVSDPFYVKGAPWYVAARPLVLNLDKNDMGGDVDDELDDAAEKMPANRVEFVNFGATQPLPMGDVLYIGSIDGTPLYATRSDIGGLMPDLEAKLRVTTDLDKVLDDETFATRFANEIQTFYTVVEPGSANCVFQPMSSTHVVRRTRG